MTDFFNDDVFGFDSIKSRGLETKGQLIKLHKTLLNSLLETGESDGTPLYELENKRVLYDELFAGRQLELEMSSHIEKANSSAIENQVLDDIYDESSVPVKFNFYDDKYLVIDTPLIFKNSERYANLKQLSLLAREVECVAKVYEKHNNISLARKIKAPFWLVMVRKIRKGYAGNMADTDNIETKKISNVISKILFLSDAPTVKRDVTLCQFVTDVADIGTSFVITEEKNIVALIEQYTKHGCLNLK